MRPLHNLMLGVKGEIKMNEDDKTLGMEEHIMQLSEHEDVQTQVQEWLRKYGGADVAIAHLLCDRHAQASDRVALVYEDVAGKEARYTFAELRDLSAKCAGVLHGLGVAKGDRVATLLPKAPELLITTLALWRLGAVHVPLFTAFGPQAITYRVGHSGTRVVVTDTTNRAKSARRMACQAAPRHPSPMLSRSKDRSTTADCQATSPSGQRWRRRRPW